MKPKVFTDEQLIEDAKNYSSRAAWRAAGLVARQNGNYSAYGAAVHRGRDFMRQCCKHMVSGMVGNANRVKYSDVELIEIGRKYTHRSDWKKEHGGSYQMALRRAEVFEAATAHMTPKAHPYSGSYSVYAYEFADKHVYVGLTFLPQTRHLLHMQRGPVYEHIKICRDYSKVTLEDGISGPELVGAIEQRWMEHYKANGWILLNGRDGGSLGTIQVTKWTKEAVITEARKYQTKQDWIDGSQMSYRIAKREGWFVEASAHMPVRKLGVGAGRVVSKKTREKQRAAKLGQKLSKAHRDKISRSVKAGLAER